MCRKVVCERCGKPTFAGCGMHVEQVLGDVPEAARCHCGKAEKKESSSVGIIERFFGRGGVK